MKSSKQIEREIRDLSQKGIDLVDTPGSFAAKKTQIEQIEKQIKDLTAERDQVVFVEAQHKAFHLATGGHMGDAGSDHTAGGYGRGFGQVGTRSVLPSLAIADDEAERLFTAMKSHSSLRLELKAVADVGGLVPAQLVPGVLAFRSEPTRISSVLPSSAMGSPSVQYLRHTGTTGAAGVVAPGGVKPEVTPLVETVTLESTKIAAVVRAHDEDFDDFPGFTQFLTSAVTQSLISVENQQLLHGTGADGQVQGLLTVAGTLSRVVGTDSDADAIEQAIDDLRVGPAFTSPTAIIMHPSTFSGIRRAKDLEGRYLLTQSQDLTSTGPSALWGIPVVLTTDVAVGTAVVLDAPSAVNVWVRQGIVIDTSNSSGTDFVTNTTMFRVEERIGLAIIRPAAIVVVTGLGVAA